MRRRAVPPPRLLGVLLALCVVVLGAYVRLTDAGLGCPDWPGCYGHVTLGQAARTQHAATRRIPSGRSSRQGLAEMIHRYLAATLGS